jgi:hypothetical protein
MKKSILCLFIQVLAAIAPVVVNAQLTNGDFVTIKNASSGKFVKAKGFGVDSAIVHGTLNASSFIFSQWKVIALPGNIYMFQTRMNRNYIGIKSTEAPGDGYVVQRGRTSTNLAEISWSLLRTASGYQLKNVKSKQLLGVEGVLTQENGNLVHTTNANSVGKSWVFTSVPSTTGGGTTQNQERKVLFDVVLNYIAVSEATRNRIDNGDCRRVFGQIKTELWELDNNNQKKTRITSYESMPEFVYNQLNYLSGPTAGLSYYQDNRTEAAKNEMSKVTYNIPENLLNNRKVMLVVKTYLGTRHKDSDLSSYDAVKMKQESQTTYILDNRVSRTETIQGITERYFNDMILIGGPPIHNSVFQQGDDTHKLWVAITCKRQ